MTNTILLCNDIYIYNNLIRYPIPRNIEVPDTLLYHTRKNAPNLPIK